MTTTTLSSALDNNNRAVYLASVTGVAAGKFLFSNRELMKVLAVDSAAKCATVLRGAAGPAFAHVSGSTVYVGSANEFGGFDKSGATNETGTFINTQNGRVFTVIDGEWQYDQQGEAGSGALKIKTIVLTNSQITHLPTTPVTLVDTGDASLIPLPISVTLAGNFVAGYSNLDGDNGVFPHVFLEPDDWDLSLLGGSTETAHTMNQSLGHTGTTVDCIPIFPQFTDQSPLDLSQLQLSMVNGSNGDFEGGDASNTLTVTVIYTVVAVN